MGRQSTLRSSMPAVVGALTGGLLSSSCCVLQLVLNYTSIGCAGFSALTPYQGYFRLLTAGVLGYLFSQQGFNSRTLATLSLSLLLMFSNDAVSAYNKRTAPSSWEQLLARLHLGSSSSSSRGAAPGVPASSRYTLAVSGIKCEACASRVKGTLLHLPGVANCTVSLADGQVEVWTAAGNGSAAGVGEAGSSSSSSSGATVSGAEIVAAVEGKGYQAQLLQQQCYDLRQQQQQCPGGQQAAAAHEPQSQRSQPSDEL